MEARGWINPMHPRPLYVAELLLYSVGAALLVRALTSGPDLLVASCALVMIAAGFGLAGELRAMWVLALGACIVAARTPVMALVSDPAEVLHSAALLDLAMVLVVAGTLMHPETRAYRVRWLR